jgi:GT2 family glycosyltransferase
VPERARSRVLIVLVSFDSQAGTEELCDRYANFMREVKNRHDVQCLIWDNASHDLRSKSELVDYISSTAGNIGFGTAINQAVENRVYDRMLLVNPDIEMSIEKLDDTLSEIETLEARVIWAPSLLNPDGSPQTYSQSLYMRTLRQEISDIFGKPAVQSLRNPPLYYLRGAVLSISRETFKSVSGFDETFFLYGEEADLCFRSQPFAELRTDPRISFIHEGSQGYRGKSAAALRESFRARAALHRRYTGPVSGGLVAAIGLAMYCAIRIRSTLARPR